MSDRTIEEVVIESASDEALVKELDRRSHRSPVDRELVWAELEAVRIQAEQAYYAMHAGDMEPARKFICHAAGKIA